MYRFLGVLYGVFTPILYIEIRCDVEMLAKILQRYKERNQLTQSSLSRASAPMSTYTPRKPSDSLAAVAPFLRPLPFFLCEYSLFPGFHYLLGVMPPIFSIIVAGATIAAVASQPEYFKNILSSLVKATGYGSPGGVWRICAILLALVNLKNLPFVWHVSLHTLLPPLLQSAS
jgi:hypothetical protein